MWGDATEDLFHKKNEIIEMIKMETLKEIPQKFDFGLVESKYPIMYEQSFNFVL